VRSQVNNSDSFSFNLNQPLFVDERQHDIDLRLRILEGDQKAFREFYGKYSKWFFLTCLRYVNSKEDAQDLLQDSFIAIHRDLHQFDHTKGQLKYWCRKVVVNVCLQYLRKKSVLKDFDELEETIDVMVEESSAIDNLSVKELLNYVVQLPKGYRTIFNLYVIDGYNHKEIAQLLGISANTSKTQLMKARRMLQVKINKNNQLVKLRV